jgi:hypothetical protein
MIVFRRCGGNGFATQSRFVALLGSERDLCASSVSWRNLMHGNCSHAEISHGSGTGRGGVSDLYSNLHRPGTESPVRRAHVAFGAGSVRATPPRIALAGTT